MKKPIVKYNSKGESGNIFFILAKVRNVLRKQRRINDYNELWCKVQLSMSFEEALEHINQYVELVDEFSQKV